MKKGSSVELEVRYAETDQMAVVHHSNYLVWFEVARTRLCEEAGFHYAGIEEQGYLLVVSGASARYRQAARYGDMVVVDCRLEWVGSRVLEFVYEVHRGDDLLATGVTEHVWVERESGRHCRIPHFLRRTFLDLAGQTDLRSVRRSG